MIDKITIVDCNPQMVDECSRAFNDYKNITVIEADFFSIPADLMVSPANSFGFMDGGLDLTIRNRLGSKLEDRVQKSIRTNFLGELPIGCSLIVETLHKDWPYLGISPTMRVPMNIDGTLNVYYAFFSMLLTIIKHNEDYPTSISSVICPGLGTGIGGVSESKAAQQMAFAYKQLLEGNKYKSARQRLIENRELESLK